jgi:hypothetical protein
MSETHKRNPNIKCIICGKDIYRRPAEIQRSKGNMFCSITCYGIACRKEKPCIVCGAPILAGANKKTCSRACANRHRAGIEYKMHQPKSKVKYYKALKSRLLKARGNMCEICGYARFEILEVHHKDRDRINNSLDNLELICPNCHSEEHFLKRQVVKLLKYGGVA